MATKKHCDLCDSIINDKSGGTVTAQSNFDGTTYSGLDDLCQNHFNALKRLLGTFKVFQQGGMVDWPTERTRGG